MTKNNKYQVSWAQACRDVIIASINKGQLPLLGIIGIVFLIGWRLPVENLSILVADIVKKLSDWSLVGYALALGAIIGWIAHARSMRKEFNSEYERIGKEKSSLQNKLSPTNFSSSGK